MAGYQYLSDTDVNRLRAWHRWLNDNAGRADRARLRRAVDPVDVMPTPAFIRFLKDMPERWQQDEQIRIEDAALVATVIAHVKTDNPAKMIDGDSSKSRDFSFARSLATPRERGGRPPLSELRFFQLQKSRDTAEFYRRIVRALALLDGKASIASLANDLLHWQKEMRTMPARYPQERLAVRWATDYYAVLPD
ncbi:type I-E CRISPR-associated protein Cse2/CasB [Microbulbifer sp. SSSA002]|uniref:type I-E CRISPR-associated protein Cse2/CasB n=1 Tax=unclassified Microbulbifer TaxID=2619833 RepID=UPI00403A242B